MTTDVLSTEDELDLSSDSAVDVQEGIWILTEAEREETDTDNGAGTRYNLTFQSVENSDREITMRFFVTYESKAGKDTAWVKRSRGQLKNIIKALEGDTTRVANALTAGVEGSVVGQQVKATTRDGGDGFAVLSKFKKVA